MVATSRNFLNLVLVAANFGYEFTSNPRSGGVSEVTLADQIHLGSGFILFPAKRLQFMSEYTGLVFTGAGDTGYHFRGAQSRRWRLGRAVLYSAAVSD